MKYFHLRTTDRLGFKPQIDFSTYDLRLLLRTVDDIRTIISQYQGEIRIPDLGNFAVH